jgi:hypothetical protein
LKSLLNRTLGIVAAALFAGTASASPLYFTGPTFGPLNFGTLSGEVATAQAADSNLDVLNIDNPLPGLGMVSLSLAGSSLLPNPTCAASPADPTCLDLSVDIPPSLPVIESSNPSKADPTLATSTWDVTNTSGFALDAAFLIFVSSPGALSADSTLVGLEPVTADGYTVITFDDGFFGEIFYAAIDLGPMGLGETTQVSVHYVVADDLIPAGGLDFFLPELNTQAIVVPASVPEPGVLSLFAMGLAGLATIRRQKCI